MATLRSFTVIYVAITAHLRSNYGHLRSFTVIYVHLRSFTVIYVAITGHLRSFTVIYVAITAHLRSNYGSFTVVLRRVYDSIYSNLRLLTLQKPVYLLVIYVKFTSIYSLITFQLLSYT